MERQVLQILLRCNHAPSLETTMAEKRTRDAMEGLEQEVLEQHKMYGPETLTCTRRESGRLLSLSDSGLATAHFNKSYSLRRQEGGYTPSWPLGAPLTRRMRSGHWLFLFRRRTSTNMNSLLQTAMLNSLEACPVTWQQMVWQNSQPTREQQHPTRQHLTNW
jgi:hypothetical protein